MNPGKNTIDWLKNEQLHIDPEDFLSVADIVRKINLLGLELRSYDEPGGIACGPVSGGDVTFGFVPQKAN